MECEEVRNWFADHLNGALPADADAALRAHLAACQVCRDETASLERMWMRLVDIPAEPRDSKTMRTRFEHMLDAYVQGSAAAEPAAPARWFDINARLARWWPQWSNQPLAQAGVAAAMLFVGICTGGVMRTAPPAPPAGGDLVELRRELHDMREMLTLSLMQQQSAAERLRGVSGSSQIEQPGSEIVRALLDTLKYDPNVNVRLASVDALRRFASQDIVQQGTEQALAESSYPLVQIALIDLMVETRDMRSAEALRRLSEDPMANEAVRSRAAWGLQQLNL
jgi:hypothetical protein